MAELYKDYLPANARIIIDYKAHEKVKFSYPREWTYWKAVWQGGYVNIFKFWWQIHINISFLLVVFIGGPALIIHSILFPREGGVVKEIITVEHTIWTLLESFGLIGLVVFYIFGIPTIATFILALNRDRFSRIIPKLGELNSRMSGSIARKTFNVGDIVDKKVILPSFSNVYLNYEAKGDFSKYLEKVEIVEMKFDYHTVSMFANIFLPIIHMFMKKTQEKNDSIFSAVFHFSKKPKDGHMEVEFD